MQKSRIARVAEQLRQKLGQLITTRLKDPRIGFVTLTHVEVAPDLKQARVFFSLIGTEKERKSTSIALNWSRGFLQREIARLLTLRFTPKLEFIFDTAIQESIHLDEILQKIHEEAG